MSQRKLAGVGAIVIALGLMVAALVIPAYAQGPGDCDFGRMWGGSRGMMGGRGGMMGGGFPQECAESAWFGMGMMGGMMGHMGMGSMMGMMADFSNMGRFGPGSGMMGAWPPPADLVPAGGVRTLDQAVEIAEAYIAAWDSQQPLELGEVMQFSNHFYGEAVESESRRGAFEFLIDPASGTVFGEPGPNMMWNLRYGMGLAMGMWTPQESDEAMTVTPEEARDYAQAYLDRVLPGTQIDEEAEPFYGYYTLHILRAGEIVGMLSVNGYSGQAWLHHWHGDFIGMTGHRD